MQLGRFKNRTHRAPVKQANKITFITHGFQVSVISSVRERVRDLVSPLRFMLRRSSLVECVIVLRGACRASKPKDLNRIGQIS
jgi:hypothetical protein